MKELLHALLLIVVVAGCGTTPPKESVADQSKIIVTDLVMIKNDCDQNKKALACAQYAYKLKNIDQSIYLTYVTHACELGDESSCFNMDQIKGRTGQYNIGILKREENQIFACYAYYTEDIRAESVKMGEQENKLLNITALVDEAGVLKKLTLDGRQINPKLEECVMKIFANKKFLGSDKEALISLTLLFPMKYKEKDMALNRLDGLNESLKKLK